MNDTPRRGPGRPRKDAENDDLVTVKIGWRSVWTSQGVKTAEKVDLPADEAKGYVDAGLAKNV